MKRKFVLSIEGRDDAVKRAVEFFENVFGFVCYCDVLWEIKFDEIEEKKEMKK